MRPSTSRCLIRRFTSFIPFAFAAAGAFRGKSSRVLLSTPPRRPPASLAPSLAVLSWAVDGTGRSWGGCRRRLDFARRIPLIVEAVHAAAADVVALQDSTPALAEALCAGGEEFTPSEGLQPAALSAIRSVDKLARWRGPQGLSSLAEDMKGTVEENGEKAEKVEEVAYSHGVSASVRYVLVGVARNGQNGELQIFVRESSPWAARLMPAAVGLTVGLSAGDAVCVLTNVDLSYRGKSLAVGGRMLTTAAVSAEGSAFTLTHATGGGGEKGGRLRAEGQLDAHREIALDFIARTARPDLLVGNVFMGKSEGLKGYEDAWEVAGAPPTEERTTNTFYSHWRDRETNYYYFVPTAGVAASARLSAAARKKPRDKEADHHNDSSTVVASADAGAGVAIPLASRSAEDGSWRLPNAFYSSFSSPSSTPTSCEGLETDRWLGLQRELDLRRGQGGGPFSSLSSTLGVPEVAGRFQRCFLRSQTWGNRRFGGFPRGRRCRVVVLRPLVEVEVGPLEAAWHPAQHPSSPPYFSSRGNCLQKTQEGSDTTEMKGGELNTSNDPGEASSAEKIEVKGEWSGESTDSSPHKVTFSLSDQYPLLTLLY